ncbi:MAG TPA: helix-turn-helix transcriptional regulator [Spirochaetia bacterium]|nr:helix-turn-helix transcriptional regulator [Spirochaetia bacterium]
MLHVFLAFYMVSFSLGLVVIAIGLLSYVRSGFVIFRHFAILFVAAVILLLCRMLKVYEHATAELVFGGHLPVLAAALTVPGNGLLAWMTCTAVSEIVSEQVSGLRLLGCVALALGAAVLGGMRESLPQAIFRVLNNIGLTVLLAFVTVALIGSAGRARNARYPALIRGIAVVAATAVPAMVVQIVLQATDSASPQVRSFAFVQIALYLALAALVLFHSTRYLFQSETVDAFSLPDEVASRYGISPREREIITMLVRGYTNRIIGEKLFISTTTVKNHIYHIYQKTGVTNKIQLINLLNSPK